MTETTSSGAPSSSVNESARRPGESRATAVAVLVTIGAASGLLLIQLCNVVFACGCRSWWAGAAAACNIHAQTGPHCPWCAAGWWGLVVPYGAILGSQAVVLLWPGRASLLARALVAAAAFPAVGTTIAVLWGMITGYWR